MFDNVWIVDPGDTEAVFEWMETRSKTTISGILLSHAHFDHIYGISEIISRYPNCIIYTSNDYGKEALHNPKINGSRYTEEGPIVISDNAIIKYYDKTMMLWEDIDMQTIYTPGHSDDSQCLIVDGILFSGDTLIKNVRTVTKLKSGSVEKLEDSIKLISTFKGSHLKVMSGHGDDFDLDEYDIIQATKNKLNMYC